eukprot:TRINITY_DN7859_c0_g1_i6.p3 TRINITY_DN7859_c0_g1~~TRINITY_DN7859_c0_g1_i6.p3  ORF type:complete len:121 (-),score=7.88 TRINITY_DN7859_c0_g1_i6:1-363(-)
MSSFFFGSCIVRWKEEKEWEEFVFCCCCVCFTIVCVFFFWNFFFSPQTQTKKTKKKEVKSKPPFCSAFAAPLRASRKRTLSAGVAFFFWLFFVCVLRFCCDLSSVRNPPPLESSFLFCLF